ncbi:hypothetical protein BJV74DRAFT_798251 [Russula compacta]|nr:hypothetical protein BJV74DRAFT_798251 [Russula compacta]
MPCKKHAVKSRCKNAEKARNAKAQRPCNKIIPLTDRALQQAVEECEGDQDEEEMYLEDSLEECEDNQEEEGMDLEDGLEIVKQLALDHFNSILQRAQNLAVEAEKTKPQKHPGRYTGTSERTLRQ